MVAFGVGLGLILSEKSDALYTSAGCAPLMVRLSTIPIVSKNSGRPWATSASESA